MMLTRVKQEHSMGCGAACVAMVTGRTFSEVMALVPTWDGSRGWSYYSMFGLLNAFGLTYQMVFSTDTLTNERRGTWPPLEPFAPVHIACVDAPAGPHYVVWQADGTVIDPDREGLYRLTAYGDASHIIGVYRKPEPDHE